VNGGLLRQAGTVAGNLCFPLPDAGKGLIFKAKYAVIRGTGVWLCFMKKFSAVAFDVDGTLYPNFSLYIRLIPFMLRHFRLLLAFGKARAGVRKGEIRGAFCDAQAGIAARFLGEEAGAVKEKIGALIYSGWERYFKKIKPYPFVRETLEKLRANGYKTAALSDFPIGNKLKLMGLGGLWDAEISSEDTGRLKPDKAPFLALAAALETPCEEILYVGNNFNYDVTGANNAGMCSALIRRFFVPARKKAKAGFVFRDYRQLQNFLL